MNKNKFLIAAFNVATLMMMASCALPSFPVGPHSSSGNDSQDSSFNESSDDIFVSSKDETSSSSSSSQEDTNKPKLLSIKNIREGISSQSLNNGDYVKTYGYITGTMQPVEEHLYGGIYVNDGNDGIQLYQTIDNYFSQNMKIGDLICIEGLLNNYHDYWEICSKDKNDPSWIKKVTSQDKLPYEVNYPVAAPTYYKNNIKSLLNSNCSQEISIEGAEYRSGRIDSLNNNFTIKFNVGDTTVDFYLNRHIGSHQLNLLQAIINHLEVGDIVDLYGSVSTFSDHIVLRPMFFKDIEPYKCIKTLVLTLPNKIEINCRERGYYKVPSGTSCLLDVKVFPSYAFNDIVFESSNENVLTVDKNGLVTTLSEGEATVCAYSVQSHARGFMNFIITKGTFGNLRVASRLEKRCMYSLGYFKNETFSLYKNISSSNETKNYLEAAHFKFETMDYTNFLISLDGKYLTFDMNLNVCFSEKETYIEYDSINNCFKINYNSESYYLCSSYEYDNKMVFLKIVDVNAFCDRLIRPFDHLTVPQKSYFVEDGIYIIGDKEHTSYLSPRDESHAYFGMPHPYEASDIKLIKKDEGILLIDMPSGKYIKGYYHDIRLSDSPFFWHYDNDKEYFYYTDNTKGIIRDFYMVRRPNSLRFGLQKVGTPTESNPAVLYQKPAKVDPIYIGHCAKSELNVGFKTCLNPKVYPSSADQRVIVTCDDYEGLNYEDGCLVAIRPGTYKITLTSGSYSESFNLTVLPE